MYTEIAYGLNWQSLKVAFQEGITGGKPFEDVKRNPSAD
jgi:hypothetical protein